MQCIGNFGMCNRDDVSWLGFESCNLEGRNRSLVMNQCKKVEYKGGWSLWRVRRKLPLEERQIEPCVVQSSVSLMHGRNYSNCV